MFINSQRNTNQNNEKTVFSIWLAKIKMTDKPKINLENDDLISNVTSNGKRIDIMLEDKGCMGVYKFTAL